MSAALTEPSQESKTLSLFDLPGCHFSEVGLEIDPGMKFEHWERLIRSLERAEQGIQWYIGDALNYGEKEYGEKYAQVLDAHKKTGIPVETLRNYQWVADRVKPVTRVTELDWSVHREVAPLPEAKQKEILEAGVDQKRAGRKYTRRHAERDANKAKREGKPKALDTELVLSKDARGFLDAYMADLAEWADKFPLGLSESDRQTLEKMVYGHGNSALILKNRTRQTDYEAIAELFSFDEGTPGMERAVRSDISSWLEKCGYYISDSDLNERLDVMVEKGMLEVHSVEESRQDGRRGVMLDLYALSPAYEAELENRRERKSAR